MTQIKSPTGFVSTLQTALKTASTDGKAVGAPALKKALQGTDASQLSPQQKTQVRDAFEKVKLTPKARELADRFVGDGVGLKPSKDSGLVKVMMDDPTRGSKLKDFSLPDGGRVKIRMDDPIGGLKVPDFKPPEDSGVVKVMMDDPLRGSKQPELKPLDNGVVKVKMDSPV